MPYVERDEAGAIKGVYANLQPGYAEEWVEHAELVKPGHMDGTGLLLSLAFGRIEALEAGRPVPVETPVLFDPQPVEDEDPGEQPDIFTEEDVEALGAVAAEGGGEPVPGESTDDAGPGEQEQVAGAVDHGGVLVQFDDLGKLRNDVIAAITFQEIVRARPLENDTNRWDELRDLRGLAADAGKSMDPMTEAQWDRLNELERTFHGRLNEIKRHASMLRDRAFDASPEMLAAMAADIWNGGP